MCGPSCLKCQCPAAFHSRGEECPREFQVTQLVERFYQDNIAGGAPETSDSVGFTHNTLRQKTDAEKPYVCATAVPVTIGVLREMSTKRSRDEDAGARSDGKRQRRGDGSGCDDAHMDEGGGGDGVRSCVYADKCRMIGQDATPLAPCRLAGCQNYAHHVCAVERDDLGFVCNHGTCAGTSGSVGGTGPTDVSAGDGRREDSLFERVEFVAPACGLNQGFRNQAAAARRVRVLQQQARGAVLHMFDVYYLFQRAQGLDSEAAALRERLNTWRPVERDKRRVQQVRAVLSLLGLDSACISPDVVRTSDISISTLRKALVDAGRPIERRHRVEEGVEAAHEYALRSVLALPEVLEAATERWDAVCEDVWQHAEEHHSWPIPNLPDDLRRAVKWEAIKAMPVATLPMLRVVLKCALHISNIEVSPRARLGRTPLAVIGAFLHLWEPTADNDTGLREAAVVESERELLPCTNQLLPRPCGHERRGAQRADVMASLRYLSSSCLPACLFLSLLARPRHAHV